MSNHSVPRPSRRAAASRKAPAKRRWLTLWVWHRRVRLPEYRANLRAGVEGPPRYPFEPRF